MKQQEIEQAPLCDALTQAYLMDETEAITRLLDYLSFTDSQEKIIATKATALIENVRKNVAEKTLIEVLMTHYNLSTEEGIMLMCLAEALLRIPDKKTEDLLIQDKLTGALWRQHIDTSESALVNFASWGLALTGKLLSPAPDGFWGLWKRLIARSGEPIIRQAVREAIKVMSHQFVIGRTIDEALENSKKLKEKGYTFSYDMLGEVALTQSDADRYFAAYRQAIQAVGAHAQGSNLIRGSSISVKLSALYPRYEFAQRAVAVPFLAERLKTLALEAKQKGISLTMDAEEAVRLEISLDIFAKVFCDEALQDWAGLGLAVQAYQKRAFYVIDWLANLSQQQHKRVQVRLVKGAYWDTEIKLAQMKGLSDYPVFTRKTSTDVSYLACAKKMLSLQENIYPQFATHNAYSVAAILSMMDNVENYQFEFQNLQGMGKPLHDQIASRQGMNILSRIYAPVGSHEDLLPYLVRRLLENGANSSFVNQISDSRVPLEHLIASPIQKTHHYHAIPNSHIPLPCDIYGTKRLNSHGIDLTHASELDDLTQQIQAALTQEWHATPFHREINRNDAVEDIFDPADFRRKIGRAVTATAEDCELALNQSLAAYPEWNAMSWQKRINILLNVAALMEKHRAELMAMIVREGGRTLVDALSEVREAIDFCRYYAEIARDKLQPEVLPGYTGEQNTLSLHGRGVILCISPWNFPVAIFAGQLAAALVTGNSVIAKPAEPTRLVAARVVKMFHEAGVPEAVLQYLPGSGKLIGQKLVADSRIGGVMLTGSTETARIINKTLAEREGPIVPFIAETGGLNAMIADSSALPEQLVNDVIVSAFGSAGQRCSALRVLFIQEEIADRVIHLLQGAMAELRIGDPLDLCTDVGPVINAEAQVMLEKHSHDMHEKAQLIYQVMLKDNTENGTFFAPQAFEIAALRDLKGEVFGPILHVIRYKREQLDNIIDQINAMGYGLTFGIQSRINSTIDHISSRINAGNIYVNRNMIGAVVGVQPFGGGWLSGTGPKAGGPHYLLRLVRETTLTVNTTASGGNASLMVLSDEDE